MEYPGSVITKNRKGDTEVRNLIDRGEFVRYNYLNPDTGTVMESGKISLVLKSARGEQHLFLVPLRDGRFIAIADNDKKVRHAWDGNSAVKV